ncbi:hypothetical protein [Natronobeatus ordinarius]|uniref:hypothetical protein n=1 Tax=Natronobeatus ordinarius TaxID=2963433 RepID=UPI0020CE28BE|nr:hypothetical protein [Natronobeatus ordinarius]
MSDRTYTRRTIIASLFGAGGLAVTIGAGRAPDSNAAGREKRAESEPSSESERSDGPVEEREPDESVVVHELLCTCPVCMGGPGRGGPGGF